MMTMNVASSILSAIPNPVSAESGLDGLPIPIIVLSAAVVGLVLFIMCYRFPRAMMVAFVLYSLLQDNLLYLAGSRAPILAELDLLDEVILLSLYCASLLRRPIRGMSRPAALPLLLICFMLFASLNAVRSGTHLLNLTLSFRDSFAYYLFFVVLTRERVDQAFTRILVWIVVSFAVLNTLVLLIQWGLHYAFTGSFFLEDNAVGLMGPNGAHKLGYFSATLVLAYVGLARERVVRSALWLALIAACVIISSTRAVLFYLPVALTLMLGRRLFVSQRTLAAWVGALAVTALLVLGYLALPDTSRATLRPSTLYYQATRVRIGGRYTRHGFMKYTWDYLQQNKSIWFGLGPGWYASKTASRIGSPHFDALPEGVDVTLSQVAIILGEHGLIGCGLVFAIYGLLYRRMMRLSDRASSPFYRGLASGAAGSILIFLMGCFTNNLLEIQQVAIVPWLLVGCAIAGEQRSDRQAIAAAPTPAIVAMEGAACEA